MNITPELPADALAVPAGNGSDAHATPVGNGGAGLSIPSGNGRGKLRLLTRAALDGRTVAAKLYDQLVDDIQNDLGGRRKLTTIELTLVEAYASAAIALQNINTRLLLGHEIDFALHTQCVSAMVRVASRLGLQRRGKDEPLSLDAYLRSKHDEQLRSNGAAE